MNHDLPEIFRKESCDVLVIGAGLAGITAAFAAADTGASVLLCTQDRLCSGSSFYPFMDTIHCQSVLNDSDASIFFEDMCQAGQKMEDPYFSRYYTEHISQSIPYLSRLGIPYTKLPEAKLACFSKRPHALYSWKNWNQIRKIIYEKIDQENNLSLIESLKLCMLVQKDKKISGAIFYHISKRAFLYITAKSVILASGGFGSLYKHSLNTPDVTGDGHCAALKAGVFLINLEFNQFIPGFISPVYKVVFREGSLNYCQGIFDSSGKNLLSQRLSPEELQNCLSKRSLHGPFTVSDSSGIFDRILMEEALRQKDNGVWIPYKKEILKDTRSYIKDYILWLKDCLKIDIVNDKIRIAPFFHAANGGIYVGHSCETALKGLFACGECSGGIHGADRLGGNSSGSCLVFGKLAGTSAAKYALENPEISLSEKELFQQFYHEFSFSCKETPLSPEEIIPKVQTLMWENCAIIREEEKLQKTLQALQDLRRSFNPLPLLSGNSSLVCQALKAETLLTLSPALTLSMLNRRESRGGHFRKDFPATLSAYDKRFCIRLQDQKLICFPDKPTYSPPTYP